MNKKILSIGLVIASIAFAEEEKTVNLEEMVVTATKTERLASEVPIRTEVLTTEDLDLANVTNLADAMDLIPGVRTEINCQNCGTAEVRMLGLDGGYNQILLNGQSNFTGLAGVYGIDQIPTIVVDRIEVVKGGGSVLYGPQAVSGVVNVLTARPEESGVKTTYDHMSIDGAPDNKVSGIANYVGDNYAVSIYGLANTRNAVDVNGDGYSNLVQKDWDIGGVSAWFNPTDATTISTNYQYTWEDRRGGNRFEEQAHISNIAEHIRTSYHSASLKLEHEFTEELNYTLAASTSQIKRGSFYGGTGEENIETALANFATNTYNGVSATDGAIAGTDAARANALFGSPDGSVIGSTTQYGETKDENYIFDTYFNWAATDSHYITAGIQFQTEYLRDYTTDQFGNRLSELHNDHFDNLGFFLQDEWFINESWELTYGGRVDKNSELNDLMFTPRAGVRYTASEAWIWRGNLSSGFRAPQLFDEDFHVDNLGGDAQRIVNSENLKEERSYSGSIGFEYRPQRFENKMIFNSQAYYTIIEDSFTTDVQGANEVRINTDGSTIYGLEGGVTYFINNLWKVDASLNYNNARYDSAQSLEDANANLVASTNEYVESPELTSVMRLSYNNPELFNWFAGVNYLGSMLVLNEEQGFTRDTPDFFVVNSGLSKPFTFNNVEFTVKAEVKNIFDEFQEDIDRGATRDAAYFYGPRLPRTFLIGVETKF